MRGDDPPDLVDRRQHAGKRERATAHNFFAIDEHLELSVVSIFQLHIDAELAAQVSCRPGSLKACNSIPATSERDGH